MTHSKTRAETVQHLAQQLSRVERAAGTRGSRSVSAESFTGIAELDAILPNVGATEGMLVEWLAPSKGSGAEALLFRMAREAMRQDGNLVIVDPSAEFYPPTAGCWGIALQRTVVVHPENERDMFWAFEQALRCPGVAVAVCFVSQLNDRVFRRLQLAVEQGGGLGLLLRGTRYRDQPSWADVRLKVTPLKAHHTSEGREGALSPRFELQDTDSTESADTGSSDTGSSDTGSLDTGRRMLVELLRCRGRGTSRRLELEMNDETGAVRLVSQLAAPKVVRRAAGA